MNLFVSIKKYTDELYAKQENDIYGKPTLNVGVVNGGTEPILFLHIQK